MISNMISFKILGKQFLMFKKFYFLNDEKTLTFTMEEYTFSNILWIAESVSFYIQYVVA